MTVRPGTLINDRYQIDRQIGRGGMATVWLADDRLLGRKVAVKILADRYASDPDFVERFRREASAAAKLSHSNIVAVFDRGEFEGNYYIVMEHLPGPDLKQIIRTQGPLDPRNAVDAALQILAALGAAHKRDVIHRDVKPQNVMVSEDGQLKVTDFGIARAGDDADMTEAGSVIGTAQYLSPEQARGDDVTTASDCYSVGIVLYEMLTGRVPFDGETPVSIAMRQVNEPPVAPRLLVPSIPDDLNDVVMHALEKRPGERFRTAQEFSEVLLAVRAHLPVPDQRTAIMPPVEPATQVIPAVRPATGEATAATRRVTPGDRVPSTTPPPRSAPPKKRRRGLMILIAIVALALIGGGAAMLFRGGDGVVVPSVTDKTAADAEQELIAAGFDVREERQYHLTIALDHVIRTSPGAGTKADRGSTVTMIVSRGQEQGTVPNVADKSWEDASTIIKDEGFLPVRRDESSLSVPVGKVIRQSPAAEAVRTKGSDVTVWVSTGPGMVRVPDLSLQPQSQAEAALRNLDLTPVVRYRETTARDPGLVVGQDPTRNTEVEEGTEVTIYISTAPTTTTTTTTGTTPSAGTITVPDVVGSNYRDAATKIQAEGLPEPISGGTVPGSEAEGTVVKQTPAAGTAVSAGTVVTIIVSDGTGSSPATGN